MKSWTVEKRLLYYILVDILPHLVYTKISMEVYIKDGDDIAFEYELQSTRKSKVTWKRYLDSWQLQNETNNSLERVAWLYERYCKQFPGDLDVWQNYIEWAMNTNSFTYKAIASLFERCLESYAKDCDNICIMFLRFSIEEYDLALLRRALNLGLKRVNRDSHVKIWGLILPFIKEVVLPLTQKYGHDTDHSYERLLVIMTKSLFHEEIEEEEEEQGDVWSAEILLRYLEVCPDDKIFDTLRQLSLTDIPDCIYTAFNKYLTKDTQLSPNTKIPYDLHWTYLKTLRKLGKLDRYEEFSNNMESIFPEQKMRLRVNLIKYYIRDAEMEKAEYLLESSLEQSMNIQEFTLIYEFNLDYEKAYTEAIIKKLQTGTKELSTEEWEPKLINHIEKLESLTNERELKLNDLKLRQDPNFIDHWVERVNLFQSEREKCHIFSQAILQIDSDKVVTPGALGKFWCDYADLYWKAGNYPEAREVCDRGLRVPYRYLTDLEQIWSWWAEHELSLGKDGLKNAINLLESALKTPNSPDLLLEIYREKKGIPAQSIVFSSLQLWTLLLDFVESSCGNDKENIEKVINIYEATIRLKVATPLIFINFAHFLQEYKDVRSSFQVYERAIGIFPPETQFQIWNIYLAESVSIENSLSNEHIRDLFDQALENLLPSKIDCKAIYVLYSNFEEKNGMFKRCVDILLQGCENTEDINNKLLLWELCLSKAKNLLGKEGSRSFYERCIKSVPNSRVTKFIIDFAKTENALGEIERARGIFKYGSQLLPPQKNRSLWDNWDEFELENGNKETYKDMLKFRRALEGSMRIDSEAESKNDGNVEFVAAKQLNNANPEEIELDI